MTDDWLSNDAMRRLLSEIEERSAASAMQMPSWLRELLDSGLVEREGALLLRQADNANHTQPDRFPDLTGYEAFINHFHIDKRDDTLDDFRLALAAVDEIRR